MTTIQEAWDKYSQVMFPPNMPPDMRQCFRQTFYGGVLAVFALVSHVGHNPDAVHRLEDELDAFIVTNREQHGVASMYGVPMV